MILHGALPAGFEMLHQEGIKGGSSITCARAVGLKCAAEEDCLAVGFEHSYFLLSANKRKCQDFQHIRRLSSPQAGLLKWSDDKKESCQNSEDHNKNKHNPQHNRNPSVMLIAAGIKAAFLHNDRRRKNRRIEPFFDG